MTQPNKTALKSISVRGFLCPKHGKVLASSCPQCAEGRA